MPGAKSCVGRPPRPARCSGRAAPGAKGVSFATVADPAGASERVAGEVAGATDCCLAVSEVLRALATAMAEKSEYKRRGRTLRVEGREKGLTQSIGFRRPPGLTYKRLRYMFG